MNSREKQGTNIVGVYIDSVSRIDILRSVRDIFNKSKLYRVATVNAEFIMEAQKDKRFREILNASDFNVADGSGILWATKYLSLPKRGVIGSVLQMVYSGASLVLWPSYCKTVISERISGVDLMVKLCGLAESEHKKVLLIGGLHGVGKRAIEKLNIQFPKLDIDSVGDNLKFLKVNGEWTYDNVVNQSILDTVNTFKPEIIFVAYGHPKQEFWIDDNKDAMPSVRIAVGVGGSFDFISGDIIRAPKLFRKLGIEWFWRLMRQPQRWSRIFTATVKFITTIVQQKLSMTR